MTRKFYLFAVMTALFLLAPTSLWADQSGTCGDNIKWTLDDQGVLTLEGTGAMENFSDSPWRYANPSKVVIGEGITTIGMKAFYSCPLTSVAIPNSVTKIGQEAFAYSYLTSVDIPNSVTSIEKGAFFQCTWLTSVTISNSLTSIADQTFMQCFNLASVTIPSSVTNIGQEAFSFCFELKSIESLAETPPTCGGKAFDIVDMNNCVLTVPANSVEAYKAAEGWKEFYSIVAGISSVTKGNNVSISASNGVITVAGVAGNNAVEVYSASGALVYRGTSNTVVVPSSGVYVVKAAGKTVKVNAAK